MGDAADTLVGSHEGRILRLEDNSYDMNALVSSQSLRFDGIEETLQAISVKLERLDNKVTRVDDRVEHMEEREDRRRARRRKIVKILVAAVGPLVALCKLWFGSKG